MADHPSGYKAFLLRLWRADNGGQPVWRLTLEEASTGHRHHFHGVEALQTFLADLTTAHAEGDDETGPAAGYSQLPGQSPREDR